MWLTDRLFCFLLSFWILFTFQVPLLNFCKTNVYFVDILFVLLLNCNIMQIFFFFEYLLRYRDTRKGISNFHEVLEIAKYLFVTFLKFFSIPVV